MNSRLLLSMTRKAVDEYRMIEEGDKIAVGLSGGKDSLTLLYGLKGLQAFYPKHFELCAITVDLGFKNLDFGKIEALCEELSIPLTIVRTTIGEVVFEDRQEKNPCALCAKLRKGALNRHALELNCNRIAYAHHKDDIIETMYMSLIFEGRIHTFSPVTYLDRSKLTVIRPLMFLTEPEILSFRNQMSLPVVKNPCPADGNTKREWAKQSLASLEKEFPGTKSRLFTAILNGHMEGWPERVTRRRGSN